LRNIHKIWYFDANSQRELSLLKQEGVCLRIKNPEGVQMRIAKFGFVVGIMSLGLAFSLSAYANESLKLPSMSTDTDEDITVDTENAVKIDQQQSAGTTTAKIGTVTEAKSKWKVGFLSENAMIPNQGSTFYSQNNINVSYDLGNDRTIQVRQYFLYNETNQDYAYEWTQGDTALQYSDAGHKIGGADNMAIARLYIPGSYYDQQVGKYELRLYDFVTQNLNKYVDLTYIVDPRFYSYTHTDAGQTGFQALYGVQATYASKSAFFTPFTTVYMQDLWGNTGKGVGLTVNGYAGVYSYNPVNQDLLNVDVGTNINLSKKITATFFYEYEMSVRGLNQSQPLDNPDSSWNLWFSASM